MTSSKMQPALLGGLFIGVFSALPVVNLGNCCCCLWVVAGGALAAWFLQQNAPGPVTASEAAVAGLLAGLLGAVVSTAISIPLNLITGPLVQGWIEQLVRNVQDLPPEFRDAFEQARQEGQSGSAGIAVAMGVVWLLISLVVYAAFAAAGGALGAVLFGKTPPRPVAPPPPLAPPSSSF